MGPVSICYTTTYVRNVFETCFNEYLRVDRVYYSPSPEPLINNIDLLDFHLTFKPKFWAFIPLLWLLTEFTFSVLVHSFLGIYSPFVQAHAQALKLTPNVSFRPTRATRSLFGIAEWFYSKRNKKKKKKIESSFWIVLIFVCHHIMNDFLSFVA